MSEGPLGIFGAGGCGRGIMPLARAQYPNRLLVFVEDVPHADTCNGHPLVALSDFACTNGASIAIAVSNPAVRQRVAAMWQATGLGFFDVRATGIITMDDVEFGPGALIAPFCTFTSNIRVGAHFHSNLYSYVEHDCRIGDFVTFAPSVRCNGNVTIGDGAYIGCGAMIRQGVKVGAGATVGMGAVVISEVAAGTTVVGNPARVLVRR